jgi:hypothetical protein
MEVDIFDLKKGDMAADQPADKELFEVIKMVSKNQ